MPDSITFDGTKGIIDEECPKCHRVLWLGICSDGSKMCQSCFFEGMSAEEINKTI